MLNRFCGISYCTENCRINKTIILFFFGFFSGLPMRPFRFPSSAAFFLSTVVLASPNTIPRKYKLHCE